MNTMWITCFVFPHLGKIHNLSTATNRLFPSFGIDSLSLRTG